MTSDNSPTRSPLRTVNPALFTEEVKDTFLRAFVEWAAFPRANQSADSLFTNFERHMVGRLKARRIAATSEGDLIA